MNHPPEVLGIVHGFEQGLDGEPVERLSESRCIRASGDRVWMPSRILKDDGPTYDYWLEFGNLYLPSFLRTLARLPLAYSVTEGYDGLAWYATVGWALSRTAVWTRFVRLYPELTIDLYSSLIQILIDLDTGMLRSTVCDLELLNGLLSCAVGLRTTFMLFWASIVPHITRSLPLETAGRFQRLTAYRTYDDGPEKAKTCADLLDVLTSEAAWEPICKKFLPWFSCEARRGEGYGTASEPSPCEEVAGGMNMCGRCQSVRYCGKAHQREDWEARHRDICMKPTW